MFDPVRLCLALGPLAMYLMLLGVVNLARRPTLVTGTRDAAALSVAISGLMLVGPLEFFFPQWIALRVGPLVWAMLLSFYILAVITILVILPPRLVIYNISIDELRPILAELMPQLDPQARWAGDSLALPGLGVQLHLDPLPGMRNVVLSSVGAEQNLKGWRRLEEALGSAFGQLDPLGRNWFGATLVVVGALLAVFLVGLVAYDPRAMSDSLRELFRL